MKRTSKRANPTSESVLDQAIETLQFGLIEIRAELDAIARGKAKDNGHDRGSRIAYLTMRVGAIADSVRKVEAARAKRIASISLPVVMAFLRQLEPDQRGRIVRELQQMDAGGSVLS